MKRNFLIIGAIICLFIFIGYWLLNPPLEAFSTTFHGSDNKRTVIPIGNKGISDIKNIEVVINGNKKPNDAIIQIIHHPSEAFSLSSDVEDGEVKELEEFNLPYGTAIKSKSENDTLSYGLTVSSNVPINEVTIRYRYFGIRYSESFPFNY